MTTQLDYAAEITALKSHLHPIPSWHVEDHPIPNGREEHWRFTPVKRFRPLLKITDPSPAELKVALPQGVTQRTIDAAQARELSFDAPVDLVAANAVSAPQASLIEVAGGAQIPDPVIIDVVGNETTMISHLLVRIAANAQLTLVLRHSGVGQLASKVEVQAGEATNVTIISVQDWSLGAVHGGQFSVLVGKDANVRTFQASIGAGDVRLVERAGYAGPGAQLKQQGLYFVKAGQHVEHRMFIDHNYPHTDSHVDYRGALQGKGAHSVWIGDVLIRKVALDIDTYETNKNLMLTEGCQADSVPNLEIETGQIRGAGHSSSTGRFDDEQLFYLRSRGIPEERARRLIVEGFFLDLIHRIGVPAIEQRLVAALNDELACVSGVAGVPELGGQEQLSKAGQQ